MNYMLDEGAFKPEYAHTEDAGMDLRTPIPFSVLPHSSYTVDTGIHVQLPQGTAGMLVSKSGLNVRHGITSTGLIDEGYTGSIRVKLYNHSERPYQFQTGDKVSQLVIIPVSHETLKKVQKFRKTSRGNNGFGSTGK